MICILGTHNNSLLNSFSPPVTTFAVCSLICLCSYVAKLGPLMQWVTRLTADPGVASSIPARSKTFVEIDHEIISMVILLLPLIQEGLLSCSFK